MPRRRMSAWGISARSAFVAATVVLVALAVAGAVFAVVVYRSMLSSIDSAAADRVANLVLALDSNGIAEINPNLLATDERIVAVQIITPEGKVVRKSPSAPDTPMIPLGEISDGLHIGIPDHPSPFGSIRFSAQTVDDGPRGRYIVLVGEGSQAIASTVWTLSLIHISEPTRPY